MQCISSFILTLAAAATLVIAVPAPMPAPTAAAAAVLEAAEAVSVTSTAALSTATPAGPAFKARGATVDSFAAQCSVGSDSVATCTGAVHATNVWEGVLEATVDSSSVGILSQKTS